MKLAIDGKREAYDPFGYNGNYIDDWLELIIFFNDENINKLQELTNEKLDFSMFDTELIHEFPEDTLYPASHSRLYEPDKLQQNIKAIDNLLQNHPDLFGYFYRFRIGENYHSDLNVIVDGILYNADADYNNCRLWRRINNEEEIIDIRDKDMFYGKIEDYFRDITIEGKIRILKFRPFEHLKSAFSTIIIYCDYAKRKGAKIFITLG